MSNAYVSLSMYWIKTSACFEISAATLFHSSGYFKSKLHWVGGWPVISTYYQSVYYELLPFQKKKLYKKLKPQKRSSVPFPNFLLNQAGALLATMRLYLYPEWTESKFVSWNIVLVISVFKRWCFYLFMPGFQHRCTSLCLFEFCLFLDALIHC